MRETMMMDAVANIHDRYVLEFADVQPVAKVGLMRWMLPAAACLCLLAGALGLRFADAPKPPILVERPAEQTTQTVQPSTESITTAPAPTGATIWGDGSFNFGFPLGYGEKGTVVMYESVLYALEKVKNPQDVLALYVFDASREEKATNEEVYTKVLKPLGVTDEDFLETGYTFLTKEQILAMKCPGDMAICLDMWYKYIPLTSEYVINANQKFFYVEVMFYPNIGAMVAADYLYPNDYAMWTKYVQAENAKRLRSVLECLGMTEWEVHTELSNYPLAGEEGAFAGPYGSGFFAKLDKETVLKLLEAKDSKEFGEFDIAETSGQGGSDM